MVTSALSFWAMSLADVSLPRSNPESELASRGETRARLHAVLASVVLGKYGLPPRKAVWWAAKRVGEATAESDDSGDDEGEDEPAPSRVRTK